MRGNIAAGSSHYGFWYRALEHPDGVSGQENKDGGIVTCPNFAPLLAFEDNVAHSTGKFGLKVNNYFPSKGGYACTSPTISEPAVFKRFTAFANNFFGIWGENLVDVHFDGLVLAEHGMAGLEFVYMNGRHSRFAHSYIQNAIFVGYLTGDGPRNRGSADSRAAKFMRLEDTEEVFLGLEDRDMLDNEYVHAVHVPGAGSELTFRNITATRYESAFMGCIWCSKGRGGYEVQLENIQLADVGQFASFTHWESNVFVDTDGSVTGQREARIVPPSNTWNPLVNPHCRYDARGKSAICNQVVRLISI